MRTLAWLRADLRVRDNRTLSRACAGAQEMTPVFVLDPRLLGDRELPRVRFLLEGLRALRRDLESRGSSLLVRHGQPHRVLRELVAETGAERVVWSREAGPWASRRDERVRIALDKEGARVQTVKDRVIFESGEVLNGEGRPYAVYTPYRNAWLRRWEEAPEYEERAPRFPPPIPGCRSDELPTVSVRAGLPPAGEAAARRRLFRFLDRSVARYAEDRDYPALDATSRLSAHLRFGMISARTCIGAALDLAETEPGAAAGARKWVDELIWREFYHAVLAAHPHVTRRAWRREFDAVRWEQDDAGFAAWCEGRTGYPIVDAGMRQLRETGWMHNRARMIAASFLSKDLLIDWRRGERFFFESLVDGDPASNNGGWQWAASTGADAQPFFRIFNPTSQAEKFDPDGEYVRRWVPELSRIAGVAIHRPWDAPLLAPEYPAPIVDHAERREEALRRYRAARQGSRDG